jgi:arsenate reductase (thioredoxin)
MKDEGQGGAKRRVLFLCTGNSCRSQMAEGLLRHLAGDRFEAASAGTHPSVLNPGAVAVMQEIGVDISGQKSKGLELFKGDRFDHVITVCDRAKESCPVFHGAAAMLHWSFDDPAEALGSPEEKMAVFRRVRDEIAAALRQFLASPASSAPGRAG